MEQGQGAGSPALWTGGPLLCGLWGQRGAAQRQYAPNEVREEITIHLEEPELDKLKCDEVIAVLPSRMFPLHILISYLILSCVLWMLFKVMSTLLCLYNLLPNVIRKISGHPGTPENTYTQLCSVDTMSKEPEVGKDMLFVYSVDIALNWYGH